MSRPTVSISLPFNPAALPGTEMRAARRHIAENLRFVQMIVLSDPPPEELQSLAEALGQFADEVDPDAPY
jgi:hypothetical protein